MTVGAMANIDRALLVSEWVPDQYGGSRCPSCSGFQPNDHAVNPSYWGHVRDCAHDLSLCERGYPDQASRDRARAMLRAASEPTLVPPPTGAA